MARCNLHFALPKTLPVIKQNQQRLSMLTRTNHEQKVIYLLGGGILFIRITARVILITISHTNTEHKIK
jgi:hypothetical protein